MADRKRKTSGENQAIATIGDFDRIFLPRHRQGKSSSDTSGKAIGARALRNFRSSLNS